MRTGLYVYRKRLVRQQASARNVVYPQLDGRKAIHTAVVLSVQLNTPGHGLPGYFTPSTSELAGLDEKIESLLVAPVPDLLSRFGVGPDTAAALLVAAGDNPERLHSEAAWAHLCGVSPIPADSGKSAGHLRHHQGGDRQANSALWRIVMVRIAHDPETTAYFERRVKEGRTKRDVIRILKRYVAREVYRYLPRG